MAFITYIHATVNKRKLAFGIENESDCVQGVCMKNEK